MAVKVSKAQDKYSGKPVTVTDCEGGYSSDYICDTEGCGADMSFVPSFEKRLLDKNHNEKVIVIPSFFRLYRNQHHTTSCPFNTKSAVTIIARSSDSNVLKSIDDGKFEFSLQILHKPKEEPKNKREGSSGKNISGKPATTKKYKNKGTAISYIKTLNQVLTLRAKLESDSELGQHVKLSYQGMKIPWNEFYFETDRYINACRILGKITHEYPMCFHGWVKSISKPEHLKYPVLKLKSPQRNAIDGVKEIPSIAINIADPNFDIATLDEGSDVLVYGKANCIPADNLWSPPKQENPDKIQFLNMTIWVNHERQVVVI